MSPTTNSIVQWRPHLECNLRPGGWRVGIPPPPGVAVRMRCGPAESCLYFPLNDPLQLRTIQRTGPFIGQQHIHVFLSLPALSSLLMKTIQSAMLSAQEGQIKNEIFLCPEDHRSAISWEEPWNKGTSLRGRRQSKSREGLETSWGRGALHRPSALISLPQQSPEQTSTPLPASTG